LSKKWGEANNCYLAERFNLSPSQQDQWIPQIVFSLWRFSIDRWIARNEFIYGKTQEDQISKKNAEIDLAIRDLFLFHQTSIRDCNKHLFNLPIEDRLKHTLEQKQLWTECVKVAMIGWNSEQEIKIRELNTLLSLKGEHQDNIANTAAFTVITDLPTAGYHHTTSIHEGRRPRVRLR
jgi:hypothetical protein